MSEQRSSLTRGLASELLVRQDSVMRLIRATFRSRPVLWRTAVSKKPNTIRSSRYVVPVFSLLPLIAGVESI